MEVLHPRCAGLDVHKDSVVACIRIPRGRKMAHQVETVGTTTQALRRLNDWLNKQKVTHVAMEATGVYWKPVWHVLEGSFDLVLANPTHIKNVPGRKTDVNDATRISDLLAHGLIRSSFVPPTGIQDMRALMRTRKQLVRERAQHLQRIHKTFEHANFKIASVISDATGVSGRRILEALIDGKTEPEELLAKTNKTSSSQSFDAVGSVARTHTSEPPFPTAAAFGTDRGAGASNHENRRRGGCVDGPFSCQGREIDDDAWY